jgi:hypothetical protein
MSSSHLISSHLIAFDEALNCKKHSGPMKNNSDFMYMIGEFVA